MKFSGTLIIADPEAILEGDLPNILTTFVSEETIKEIIKKNNDIFNF